MTHTDKQADSKYETICIGVIAEKIGYAEIGKICDAGKAMYNYIQNLTYKQFSEIKKEKK